MQVMTKNLQNVVDKHSVSGAANGPMDRWTDEPMAMVLQRSIETHLQTQKAPRSRRSTHAGLGVGA